MAQSKGENAGGQNKGGPTLAASVYSGKTRDSDKGGRAGKSDQLIIWFGRKKRGWGAPPTDAAGGG